MRHFDIKIAYLIEKLSDEIFMKQPPVFKILDHEEKVLKLNKSIYGLKQSAREWNKRITDILLEIGFKPSESCEKFMRYLETTVEKTSWLQSNEERTLVCCVDADWTGDSNDRKSTSGYIFQFAKSSKAWSSGKQASVAMSLTETEYVAASHVSQELIWLRKLLTVMKVNINQPIIIYEDNQGCIRLIESYKCGARTKHNNICHHHKRDLREKKIIQIKYRPSNEMRADILTKALSKDVFQKFSNFLGSRNDDQSKPSEARGGSLLL